MPAAFAKSPTSTITTIKKWNQALKGGHPKVACLYLITKEPTAVTSRMAASKLESRHIKMYGSSNKFKNMGKIESPATSNHAQCSFALEELGSLRAANRWFGE